MIYYLRVERADLGDWLDGGRSRDVAHAQTIRDVVSEFGRGTDVVIVWAGQPVLGTPPALIVTADGARHDFLAWTATFLPQFRPLTSHFRVVEHSELNHSSTPWRSTDDRVFRRTGIGLILTEFLSQDGGRRNKKDVVPVVNLFSGLSFVCLRELCVGTGARLDELASRWARLRTVTRQRPRAITPSSLLAAVRVVAHVEGHDSSFSLTKVERAIVDAFSVWRQDAGARVELAGVPEFALARVTPDQTREVRLRRFEEALRQMVQRSSGESELDAFAVGFMANSLDPGSLTYLELVTSYLAKWPSALIWYGVCAGMSDGSTVASELSGVGLRAWREVVRPDYLLAVPTADLSLEELEVFLNSDRPTEDYPLLSHAFASVELFPSLWTTVSWGGRKSPESETSTMSTRDTHRDDAERELAVLLARAQNLVGQLSRGSIVLRERQTALGLEENIGRKGKQRR